MFARTGKSTQEESNARKEGNVEAERKPRRRRSWGRRTEHQDERKNDKRNESEKGRGLDENQREEASALVQSPSDGSGSFFGGTKKQKKIVYKTFSDSPCQSLTLVVEPIPEPIDEDSVTIKVLVSFLYREVSM